MVIASSFLNYLPCRYDKRKRTKLKKEKKPPILTRAVVIGAGVTLIKVDRRPSLISVAKM